MPATDADLRADRMHDDPKKGFIATLESMARHAEAQAPGESVAIRDLVDQLDERAFGLLIFLLALPCAVPALPAAQLIAVPIFLLALQILFGRHEPWLPNWFLKAKVKTSWIRGTAAFAAKYLGWAERAARPRLTFLAIGAGERAAALIVALAALTIMLPITNVVPSVGVVLVALGLIERDGALILIGALICMAWVALLGGVVAAVATGAGFASDHVERYAPWLLEWFGR